MRNLNKVIKKMAYPITDVETSISLLGEQKLFSTVDLKEAFHAIELDEDSKPLTAITTTFGLYQYKRALFGLSVLPAFYCQKIHEVFKHLDDNTVIPYFNEPVLSPKHLNNMCKI